MGKRPKERGSVPCHGSGDRGGCAVFFWEDNIKKRVGFGVIKQEEHMEH